MEPIWSLGLMSGTSLDGIDAAWLKTDGHTIQEVGGGMICPYPSFLREKIRSVLGQKRMTPEIQSLEQELTLLHVQVVKQVIQEVEDQYPLSLIGFHGQTIFHAPPQTWQIGNGKLLAQKVGIDVIYNFRAADVAQGGQGAPLVPIFHQAILKGKKPSAIINIGGVANITWTQQDQPPIAYDIGPGGALLDDWVLRTTGCPYDQDGLLSAQGTAHEPIITRWLMHPYFTKPSPKSLDRLAFLNFLEDIKHLSPKDGAATLTELTSRSIIHALVQMGEQPEKLYITGGGRQNKFLMQRLTTLAPCPVEPIETLGWNGDLLEAYAFAYLAVRAKAGLPTSFPTTTGVSCSVSGGQWASSEN